MKNAYIIVKTNAFVVHTRESGDSDRYIKMITEENGVVEVFARSIRKETAKMRTIMLPYQFVNVSFIVGQKKILKDARVVNPLTEIWKDTGKYTPYVSVLRQIHAMVPVNEQASKVLYDILLKTVSLLSAGNKDMAEEIGVMASVCVLSMLGYIDDPSVSLDTFEKNVLAMKNSEKQKRHFRTCIQNALMHQ